MKLFFLTFIFCLISSVFVSPAFAQVIQLQPVEESSISASLSALLASESATASQAAKVEEKIQQKSETDITETQGAVKSRLAQYLDDNPIGGLTPFNFIQHAIRRAVNQGVPANMLVLMLLFPVIASLIAVSRHVIGLQGFGVYTPAVLAVAFVSTGISTGILLFIIIIIGAIIGKTLLQYFKLQYLPRTALLLWMVSLLVFTFLLLSPYVVSFFNLVAVGIFPILVLILLSENFIGSQLSVNYSRLFELTLETLVLAIGSALLMRMNLTQEFVILHPEATILVVAILDYAVGKYTGLRIAEYFRFKPIMDEEE